MWAWWNICLRRITGLGNNPLQPPQNLPRGHWTLQRTRRVLLPSSSPVVADISSSDLRGWLDDLYPGCDAPVMERRASHAAAGPGSASPPGTVPLSLFSTNDYLGLSGHASVRAAVAAEAALHGCGPRSASIVAGHTAAHRELETALAALKGAEDCLLFPTGYAANVGAVTALMAGGGGCVVFSDELNHASIIDGARLGARAGAETRVYRHSDLGHLDRLLGESAQEGKRALVVTDSLFSMDGDFADLRGLAALKRKHGFLLAVDEAHATLVCGETGAGAAEMMGVADSVDVHVGTLSKAFGAQGGFVAASRGVVSWLANRGRPYVFSTALPTTTVAAAQAALRTAGDRPELRERLWGLVRRAGGALGCAAESPIIPVVVGDEAEALRLSASLLGRGIHVPAIRPPTVPAGTSRLRISLSAAHSAEDVDALARELGALRAAGGRGPTAPGAERSRM